MSAGKDNKALFEYLVALADDHLILGHRLSQWCGHAPMLEEDLALTNIALDLLGQASSLFTYAGEVEGRGRGEDDLAYGRKENEYRNLMLVERENGDFAHTIMRQFLFSVFAENVWEALASSSDIRLAAIAGKALKEATYHVRHTAEWVIRLGDGTPESMLRINDAIISLSPNVSEMFENFDTAKGLIKDRVVVDHQLLRQAWDAKIGTVFARANIDIGLLNVPPVNGARLGRHTEAMGHILAELQYMQRAYPGCQW